MTAAIIPPEVALLSEVSARIGADPLLIQGPGGNTSIKRGDELWVKASGVWLAEALERPIFAGVSLASARSEDVLAGARADPLDGADPDLRPSIETPLHALMPHPAVVHAHAINSMTLSVLDDGEARAAWALEGLNWAWIPYARPGQPLARAIRTALAHNPADILILRNHGVVVGAETPAAAEALLRDVERRLYFAPRAINARPETDSVEEAVGYELVPLLAPLACDPRLFDIVTSAPLFPDQVVFLGGAVPGARSVTGVAAEAEAIEKRTGVTPALMLVPGTGAFGRRGRSAAADAVITGLLEVARRIPDDTGIRSLTGADAAALLNMEEEAYRIKLAEKRAR